jgi:hypothetical protein
MGIIGTGLLAIPVLAGSAAFAVAESFRWRRGLDLSPMRGARFYGVIAAATMIGVGLGFTHLDPIKALFFAAVPRRRAARYRPAEYERLRRRSPATGRSRPSEDGQ